MMFLSKILLLLSMARSTKAFSVTSIHSRQQRSPGQALSVSFFDHGDSEAEQMLRSRTCFRNLLTQRAIQTFMCLLQSCRDPHTVDWIQAVLHADNLDYFHGTGAFNFTLFPTWDSVLMEMLSQPKEVVVVKTKSIRASSGRGWRGQIGRWIDGDETKKSKKKIAQKKNPYLEGEQERVLKFEIEIDPASLVSRILSVREQIASEFKVDCETMIQANDHIIASYFETQEHSRTEDSERRREIKVDSEDHTDDDDGDSSLIIPYSDISTSADKKNAFDRYNAMQLLTNSIISSDRESSPLRNGNFDLLLLLSTQESIHQILKEYSLAGDEREVSFAWLRDFYLKRVQQFFDGHQQQYGRADDFLEELLLSPPILKSLDGKNPRDREVVGLIDPLRIAEDILRVRSEVGREWKAIAESIPNEHMAIRRSVLAMQMGKVVELDLGFVGERSSDPLKDAGEFE